MNDFKTRFYAVVQRQDDDFSRIYEDFVNLSKQNVREWEAFGKDNRKTERYEKLKAHGYIAEAEIDVDVYTEFVANKHYHRFKKLYGNFFEQYGSYLMGGVNLVAWGCGCGLDLLAFYECAMRQKNKYYLWTMVHQVILVDISESALKRAKDVAEVLFPIASIETHRVNFKDVNPQKLLPQSNLSRPLIFEPTIHLCSNVVDLFSDAEAKNLFEWIKECSARLYPTQKKSWFLYNDIFLLFSPDYERRGLLQNRMNLLAEKIFKEEKEKGYIERLPEMADDRCGISMALVCQTLKRSNYFAKYHEGNPFLRRLVKKIPRDLDDNQRPVLLSILRKLSNTKINQEDFFSSYEWVCVRRVNNKAKNRISRIDCFPRKEKGIPPCAILFGKSKGSMKNEIDKFFRALNNNELHYKNLKRDLNFLVWQGETNTLSEWRQNNDYLPLKASLQWRLSDVDDFSGIFEVNPHGVEPLPSEKDLDPSQKKIVLARSQFMKIRGSAGCGKTTAMMMHAIFSLIRMRLPVLLTCKTVTLTLYNKRRMAATLLQKYGDWLETIDADMIQFHTVDKVLHSYAKASLGCEILKYVNREDEGQSKNISLSPCEKKKCCIKCKDQLKELLKDKRLPLIQSSDFQYGSVLVDELQSVDPTSVDVLYYVFQKSNPNSEFYVFCDGKQCLEMRSLEESQEEGRKMRVRVPNGGHGFGRWICLTRPYRQKDDFSGKLSQIASVVRGFLNNRYGYSLVNPITQKARQMGLKLSRASVFHIQPIIGQHLCESIEETVDALMRYEAKKITVIFERSETCRELCPYASERGWKVTHRLAEDFSQEQQLRANFQEEEGIQLITIDLAQGWSFECVVLVFESESPRQPNTNNARNILERLLTGLTRATKYLRVLDRSPSQWLFKEFERFND